MGSVKSTDIAGYLKEYGAVILMAGYDTTYTFEEVFMLSLGFLEDTRLRNGFCAALIIQAKSKVINIGRIFALIGGNPYLIEKAHQEAHFCSVLVKNMAEVPGKDRASQQLKDIMDTAHEILGRRPFGTFCGDDVTATWEFVKECLELNGRLNGESPLK